jgi:hypothetical protein
MYLCWQLKEGNSAAPDTVLMSKRCGSDIPGPIRSSKNHMYVHFVTDSSRTYPGFRMEWIVDGKECLRFKFISVIQFAVFILLQVIDSN